MIWAFRGGLEQLDRWLDVDAALLCRRRSLGMLLTLLLLGDLFEIMTVLIGSAPLGLPH